MSTDRPRRLHPRAGGVVAILVALVVNASAVAAAPVPVTLPGEGDEAIALLTDVSVAAGPTAERVEFEFADDVVPESTMTFADPPFVNIPGVEVPVAGSAWVRIQMTPASGVDLGGGCEPLPQATPAAGEEAVGVYWSCPAGTPGADPVVRATRSVPEGSPEQVLAATVEQLLGGPDADEGAAGVTSLFSTATAGLLSGVTIDADGLATIDFDPSLAEALPEASASAASEQLLRELDATVVNATGVSAAEYQLGGSCDDFFAWLQRSCELRSEEDAAEALVAVTYLGPDRVAGAPGGLVTEVVQISDFEANLIWVVGLSEAAAVDATTATDPARLVLEITPETAVAPPAAPVPAAPTFTG